MNDLAPWIFLAVMAAFFFATRVMGKASSGDARKLVADGALLLDVRSPAEFASGHLDGARNIPVDQLAVRATELGDKARPVVVYCRSGARSAMAASTLKRMGWQKVADLGAMSRW